MTTILLRTPRALAVLLGLALAADAAHAGIEAQIDRSRLSMGESLHLLLRDRGGSAAPDLAPLQDDFEILDVRQSQRTSIVNGHRDQSVDWIVQLAPRRVGELTVPAVPVGRDSSTPLTVIVTEQPPAGSGANAAPAWIEIEVDDDEPFVQGQVVLTARLFADASVRRGALELVAPPGAVVERLGEDSHYRTQRDGRELSVIERQYAILPQQSGPLSVGPLVFDGVRSEPRGRRSSPVGGSLFDDVFGGDPFAGFGGDPFGAPFGGLLGGGSAFGELFDRGQQLRVRSELVELDVKPRPIDSGDWFLPARDVVLVEEWDPDPPTFRVGEQVTRTMAVQARGLSGAQLPVPPMVEVAGLKQYPEPARDDTLVMGEDLVAVKLQQVVMIPTRAGPLTLPAIEVAWWDTDTDTAAMAVLPERTVQVLDENGRAVVGGAPPGGAEVAPSRDATPTTDGGAGGGGELPAGTLVGVAVALVAAGGTVTAVRRRRRFDGPNPETARTAPRTDRASFSRAQGELRAACAADDPRRASAALVAVGRALWPDASLAGAGAVARATGDAHLIEVVEDLQHSGYAPEATAPWQGVILWRAWQSARRARAERSRRRREVLPPLYPRR